MVVDVRGIVLAGVCVMAAGSTNLWAQEAPQPTREQILQRIEALEAELAQLKAAVERKPPEAAKAEVTEEEKVFNDYLHDLKYGVSLDTYYGYNFNHPLGRVNLLRAYDVLSNNFTISQAGLVLETPPHVDAGRRFGARLDLQFGQATETLQGSLANEPRPWVYRNIFQAYGTYIAPIGSGLSIDFGKWASSLGYESNYSKDQINYSRSYWFNFLPFYHTGGRFHYQFTDAVGLNYWITNGTQQTEAFNNFKDQLGGLVLQPRKNVTWTINYYLGQEHPDVQIVTQPGAPTLPTQPGLSIIPVDPYFRGKLQILDSYLSWQPAASTTVSFEGDYVTNQNPDAPASQVAGGAAYLRRALSRRTAIGLRAEFLNDPDGLFSGRSQRLGEATVTYDIRVNDGFLVRTEYRRDMSNVPFFLGSTVDDRKRAQDTATLGLIWWWGTKREAW